MGRGVERCNCSLVNLTRIFYIDFDNYLKPAQNNYSLQAANFK